jgi:hypothetical protein
VNVVFMGYVSEDRFALDAMTSEGRARRRRRHSSKPAAFRWLAAKPCAGGSGVRGCTVARSF